MSYLNRFIFLLFSVLIFLFAPMQASAQSATQTAQPVQQTTPKEEASKAKVLRITEDGVRDIAGQKYPHQTVEVQILDGAEKDKKLIIKHGETSTLREEQKVKQDQTVVLLKSSTPQQTTYQIIDIYRLDSLYPLLFLFVAIVLLVSRWKGLGSLIGLGISLAVITSFIVPSILQGQDPLLTSIVGSFFIMVTTMYIAHGFSPKIHVALIATCIALVITGILSYTFVNLTFLTGLGSEDAASLRYGATGSINFEGLLLGGIIIGSLGVLDDVTTSLAAAMQELVKANPKLYFKELFDSGLRIGSEHIASLVNTLALAYAGAGLPLFLFIVLNPTNQPLWLLFNSEMVMEEIVRTLAGSIGLILAVPLTALLSAWAFQIKSK